MLFDGRSSSPPPSAEPSVVRTLVDAMLAVIIAPLCAACASPLASPTRSAVCETCWDSIRLLSPPLCDRCGNPLAAAAVPQPASGGSPAGGYGRCAGCAGSGSAIAVARAMGEYDDPLRAMLQALKYQGRRSIAPGLSLLMRVHGHALLSGADFVVPVPLHWRRRWRRGFNQAADLARGLGLPVRHALIRCRHTSSQTDLPAGQRHANVRQAFRVRSASAISTASIVLVDDVRTTGATLEACGRALVGAGAREVRALTAARVSTRPPPGHPR